MESATEKIGGEFPVALLYKALWIREHLGKEPFFSYVDSVGMPSEDVERVINKYKFNHNPAFRAEIKGIINKITKRLESGDNDLAAPFSQEDEVPF